MWATISTRLLPASWATAVTSPFPSNLGANVAPSSRSAWLRAAGSAKVYFTDPVDALRLTRAREGRYTFLSAASAEADYLPRFLEAVR